MNSLIIHGTHFSIIDTKEYITLADSFVMNKLGDGHGEAKLYVGNESHDLLEFWGSFSCNCFFLKSDFKKFLLDASDEFLNPQQNYIDRNKLNKNFYEGNQFVDSLSSEILKFQVFRVGVRPPRVYINSSSAYYNLMRNIGLPNISYVSVLKLKNDEGEIFFYFKMFLDYHNSFDDKIMEPDEIQAEKQVQESEHTQKEKQRILQARVGQGEYRSRLLLECPFCPFTMVNDERLLIASHIKPWKNSSDKEKIDPKNGFMFTPTYDKLFDRGFISFTDDKRLIVSPWLSPMNQKRLHIFSNIIIKDLPIDEKRKKYLVYHRDNILKK